MREFLIFAALILLVTFSIATELYFNYRQERQLEDCYKRLGNEEICNQIHQ